MATKIVTANRLVDGRVVYWNDGKWEEAVTAAQTAADEEQAELMLKKAEAEAAGMETYLIELGGKSPSSFRERIRARGPSIHPQLGKQGNNN